ncbi:MAG TPA: hypothetical protein VKQ72_05625, partial [Aggregatilineales bacterium]|nr:hypothetical protein [Aggregatilineales bacterium]
PAEPSNGSPFDPSDTLPVAPPNFRERLQAAQRARNNEIRPSVEIPLPGSRPRDLESAFRILDKTQPPASPTAPASDASDIPVPPTIPPAPAPDALTDAEGPNAPSNA